MIIFIILKNDMTSDSYTYKAGISHCCFYFAGDPVAVNLPLP